MSNKTDAIIDERVEIDVEMPRLWTVVFLNDDVTPMELVIDILLSVFNMEKEQAKKKTLEIHNFGAAVMGPYPFEIAEERALQSTKIARKFGSPLRVTIEEQ
jgi:ATP-dependent Clp protease adaptor protein ClpS